MSIVLPEINFILIKYLDLYVDYKNLGEVNKYYNNFIRNNKLYKEFKVFYAKRNPLLAINYAKDFHQACYNGHSRIAKYLYKKYKIDIHMSMLLWS